MAEACERGAWDDAALPNLDAGAARRAARRGAGLGRRHRAPGWRRLGAGGPDGPRSTARARGAAGRPPSPPVISSRARVDDAAPAQEAVDHVLEDAQLDRRRRRPAAPRRSASPSSRSGSWPATAIQAGGSAVAVARQQRRGVRIGVGRAAEVDAPAALHVGAR